MNLLTTGTIVEVTDPDREYLIGVIRGTGARREFDTWNGGEQLVTMYEVGRRYLAGTVWEFTPGGVWALPEHVTALQPDDVPTAAALCDDCGVPILLTPGRKKATQKWRHAGHPEDVRTEHRERAETRWSEPHKVVPADHTVADANVWDIDDATDRKYPSTNLPQNERSPAE